MSDLNKSEPNKSAKKGDESKSKSRRNNSDSAMFRRFRRYTTDGGSDQPPSSHRLSIDDINEERDYSFVLKYGWEYHTPSLYKDDICPPGDPNCDKGIHLHGHAYIFRILRPSLLEPGNKDLIFRAIDGRVFPKTWGHAYRYWVTSGDLNRPPKLYDILKSIYRQASEPNTVREVEKKHSRNKLNARQMFNMAKVSKKLRENISQEEYEALGEL